MYLLTEASIRISTAILHFSRGGYEDFRQEMWNLLLGTFYLLLVPQLFVRTLAARVSLSLVFGIQLAMIALEYAVRDPGAWWAITVAARMQVLGQIVIHSIFIAILNRKPISDLFR